MQILDIYINQLNEIFCVFGTVNCCNIPENEYSKRFFVCCKISQK
jgi:hypothetical protein